MIRTRFAPSPTGFLHIGGLRTAAYAYALAKHSKGEFLLRIEDTDQERTMPGAVEKIYAILKKFNLVWDGEVVVQSDRAKAEVYREAALKLVEAGQAFYCQCEGRNAKTDGFSTILRDPCRDKKLTSGAIKLRVPDGETLVFTDFVLRHEVKWSSNDVADTVLLKSDGQLATYHLAQAVDDRATGITHVVRDATWMTSTPIHILVHRYLGYELPAIGHPTAILDPEGGKLSKRKGNTAVEEFLSDGYLPEALFNFVILLGWAPKNNQEVFSLDDFVQAFDINGFQRANPTLALGKLDWFNGYYLRTKIDKELMDLLKPFTKHAQSEHFAKLITMVKDRLVKLSDFDGLVDFIFTEVHPDISLFPADAAEHLEFAKGIFEMQDPASEAKARGWRVGDFFMSLRVALCGSKFTPPITDVMQILGKTETMKRLDYALRLCSTSRQA